ncbi:MAG TPA: CapA family protein [Solirubrobacterales bacterium]|jgi:poly-gamma-glutamate synthesis protein (capsule biosynthesis protein)
MYGPTDRATRRRAHLSATQRRRRFAALAVLAIAALVAGIVVGSDEGGRSLTPKELVQAHREAQPVPFTVSASGDLLIHSPVWEEALALGGGSRYDFAAELNELKPYVAAADLGICHVETPMTPAPPTSYPIFNTPPELADGIRATGWDVCDTASNHSLDQGQTGIDDTGKALDRAHIRHTGSFASAAAQRKLVVTDVKGVRVALLAYTTDTNGIPAPHPWSVNIASASRVLADAKRAKQMGAEAVIVNLHWGGEILPEYQQEPSSGQLALVKKLTASPLITAIIGQGPHAVQPIERINQRFVVFSEGNLISNQSPEAGLPASSQDGIVALLHCVAEGGGVRVEKVTYVPVFVNHPDYEVLPIGDALRKGEGDATLLRASYQRTVSVVGRSKKIQPVPPKLPAG